ncbi:MAG: S1C family serine protease [Planctomycetota bacterium]|jgi:S1-C subfamily serine protease
MHPHRTYLSLLLPAVMAAAVLPAQTDDESLRNKLRTKKSLMQALQPSEDELSQRITPVVRAVKATASSVVSIYIKANGDVADPTGMRRGEWLQRQGSGVILDEKGLVITNWHVVARASRGSQLRVEARLKTGKRYRARVVSQSAEHDLALLQLSLPSSDRVKPLILGDSSSLMVGETVIAIGNPQGHANTVTVGVLSAKDRNIRVATPDGRVRAYRGLLQTDAAINHGNSGGALLDITGKLIGINNAMAANSENIGFAIPVNTVRQVFHQVLLSSENLATVFLGMTIGDRRGQTVVTAVQTHGPAARAGVRVGDQLLTAMGQTIKSKLDYARAVLDAKPAEPFTLLVQRGSRRVRLSARPLSGSAWTVIRRIGLQFEQVRYQDDPDLLKDATRGIVREIYGNRDGRPRRSLSAILRVKHVQPSSTGARLGIKRGDVLLGIEVPVRDFFRVTYRLETFQSIDTLNDALQLLALRSRKPEYETWILRDGKILSGALEIAQF